ncbi:CMRF35-like molecule 2 [Sorex araneus]|uniref:CMRF35-like molecule 2 n=1 Tax=Sorex araneus TaxID=42254 RepID=UPI002433930E|nr:CMRF35-like molecule 2 [Sorex araneus]
MGAEQNQAPGVWDILQVSELGGQMVFGEFQVLPLKMVPCSVSLRGPGSVDCTVLSMRCTYEQDEKNNSKYWCEFPCVTKLSVVVEKSATQREARRGRVTIRDDPESLTFTVTLENLMEADTGMYWCGVSQPILKRDIKAQVVVSVSPEPSPLLENLTEAGKSTYRCLLGCAPFQLLILPKVPVLLGVLGAVLWGRRRPRGLQGVAPSSLA